MPDATPQPLDLHEFHNSLGASFTAVAGFEVVQHYAEPSTEFEFLQQSAGVLDLSYRGRLCLTGQDRIRFLHGQITNNISKLGVGSGCYAALVNAKGKMESDLFVYQLPEEILLDFEPGLREIVHQRLEKYIIADDVAIHDVQEAFSLLSAQGPQSGLVIQSLDLGLPLPENRFQFIHVKHPSLGDLYLARNPRIGSIGFDLFLPRESAPAVLDKMVAAARQHRGGPCGFTALEWARVVAGIPRYTLDFDTSNLAPEAGLDAVAIQYDKGCYIGQEVIARIRTYGQVAKALRLLSFSPEAPAPVRGDKLWSSGKEVGYVTSAFDIPGRGRLGMGYVRKEHHAPGHQLQLKTGGKESDVLITGLPFPQNPIGNS